MIVISYFISLSLIGTNMNIMTSVIQQFANVFTELVSKFLKQDAIAHIDSLGLAQQLVPIFAGVVAVGLQLNPLPVLLSLLTLLVQGVQKLGFHLLVDFFPFVRVASELVHDILPCVEFNTER